MIAILLCLDFIFICILFILIVMYVENEIRLYKYKKKLGFDAECYSSSLTVDGPTDLGGSVDSAIRKSAEELTIRETQLATWSSVDLTGVSEMPVPEETKREVGEIKISRFVNEVEI